jgi:hypothetical protein
MTFLSRRFLLLGILLVLALGASVVSAETAYEEGIHVTFVESHHNSVNAEIHAVKHVDGRWRQTEIYFRYDYAYVDGSRHIEGTVVLSGDPDNLEVSRDLGWGGLDGTVWMQQRRRDCDYSSSVYTCSPEIVEWVPVTFHISQVANAPYTETGDYFTRTATVRGTVTVGNRYPHRLEIGYGLFSRGYNFSDQYPG